MTPPRRRLVAILAFALTLACFCLAGPSRFGRRHARDARPRDPGGRHDSRSQEPGDTQGSGFIVDPEGILVTVHHVIAGATRAHVVLPNGAHLEVDGVLAADRRHDVALLRVTAPRDLQTVMLGDSDAMRRGDRVYVLGSPQGLELTATDGIVSAPVRQSPSGRASLQITAPIFGGSSGGPVLSAQGEAIGIARSFHRDAQSLTFATPINVVKSLLAAKSPVALPFPPVDAPSP